jgi:hypothetical protein
LMSSQWKKGSNSLSLNIDRRELHCSQWNKE